MTRHYGRRPAVRPARAPNRRQVFVAAFVAAGVPAGEANATWHAVARLGRRLRGRPVSLARVRQLTGLITGPVLARARAA